MDYFLLEKYEEDEGKEDVSVFDDLYLSLDIDYGPDWKEICRKERWEEEDLHEHCCHVANQKLKRRKRIKHKGYSWQYPKEWTRELKWEIRTRDNYTCWICKDKEKRGELGFSVHHIDYDKANCKEDNLITLCRYCHGRTNSNREAWITIFKERG